MISILRTAALFAITACAEIGGCYLFYLWLRIRKPAWVLVPSAICLGLYAWLLTLHPGAAGRTYAAYGGMYVTLALFWLWFIDNQRPDRWDVLGVMVCLIGMGIIAFAPRS
ncbi:MAG TPA: YnfA family protein [Blastocatellia bacterium]|nr:YnfA family protein [Blastocatellia bacterium]